MVKKLKKRRVKMNKKKDKIEKLKIEIFDLLREQAKLRIKANSLEIEQNKKARELEQLEKAKNA